MSLKNRTSVAMAFAFCLLLCPYVVQAGPFYFGLHGELSLLDDADLEGSTNPVAVEFDPGFASGAAVGYSLDKGRVELEFTYRKNDIDAIEIVGMSFDPGGSVSAASVMVNSYADYSLTPNWSAYFTLGLGAAQVAIDQDLSLSLDFSEDDDIVFAYQGGFGMSYLLARPLALDVGYKYLATLDPEFSTVSGEKIETEYQTHNLFVGLRYSF